MCVYFVNNLEDFDYVRCLMFWFDNVWVDLVVRVLEIGCYLFDRVWALFIRFQDRIFFVIDIGIGCCGLMFGLIGVDEFIEEDVV